MRARVFVVDAPFSVSIAKHSDTATRTGQRLSEEVDTTIISSVVENSRNSQTLVCHLPADILRSDFLVYGPYFGLQPHPVSKRRTLEVRHRKMR
jgi:hypothetical protein